MDENNDWINIENKIKNINYPLTFIFKLFKYNENITDNNLSLIIRFFFKYHYKTALKYNLINLTILIDKSKIISIKIIMDFYNLIKRKFDIIKIIISWKDFDKDKQFWKLNIIEQIKYIEKRKEIFLSNFDVTKSSILYHNKIYPILKEDPNNFFILNNLIKRLRNIYLLFDRNFFTNFKIIVITRDKFLELNIEQKMKYCTYIFNKINKILYTLHNSFLIYKYTENQLNNLINPKHIIFNNSIINSETDLDDILFIIKD